MSHTQVELDSAQEAAENELEDQRDLSLAGLDRILNFIRLYPLDSRLLQRFFERYEAAGMAWMAGGMARDREQEWPVGKFHRHFIETRKSSATSHNHRTTLTKLTWHAVDMLTALDRVSGGATIMLHVDGKLRAGSPPTPEAVNPPTVYFTPFIKEEIAGGDIAIARLTQMFVECIGLPASQRWEGAMAQLEVELGPEMKTTLRRPYHPRTDDESTPPPLIPTPHSARSSLYLIPGRPTNAVERAIKHFHPDVEDRTVLESLQYKNLQAEYDELQEQYEELEKQLVESQARAAHLEKQLASRRDVLIELSQMHEDAGKLLDKVDTNIDMVQSNEAHESDDDNSTDSGSTTELSHSESGSPETDVSMSIFDEVIDSPLRRQIRLPDSESRSAQRRRTRPLRLTPLWEFFRPFGLAAEAVMEEYEMSRDHITLPRIRELFKDEEHDRWFAILKMFTYYESRESIRALVEAMHQDCGLVFDEDTCIKD